MGRPTCSDVECDRPVVRYRDGAGYCLFHPDAQPPVLDAKTGKPIAATPPAQPRPRPKKAAPREPKPYRAPGRVVVAPAAKPTPRDLAAAFDDAAARVSELAPPSDGLCPVEGCDRPWRHRGWHTKPKPARPARVPRPPRPVEQPPADGRCRVEGCVLAWRHRGAHSKPVDADEAVRRYTAGEGLFELAADLHVGAKRLRQVLTDAGVTIRKRGEVVGIRGPVPRPIDVAECLRLYANGSGLTARAIAEQLEVKARRVYDVLRAEGVLGPPGGREPGPGSLNAVRLKLTAEETTAVRGRAAELGMSMNAYLRGLVLADLAPADEEGAA